MVVVVGPPVTGTDGGTNEQPTMVAVTSTAPMAAIQILRIVRPPHFRPAVGKLAALRRPPTAGQSISVAHSGV